MNTEDKECKINIDNNKNIDVEILPDKNIYFNYLGISPHLISSIKKQGITSPTEVQKKVIPQILNGKNILARSNTGTGKTLAFLLPIVERMTKKNNETALILVPTRELVIQIAAEAEKIVENINCKDNYIDKNISKNLDNYGYVNKPNNIKENCVNILPIYGGKQINKQINKLKNKINIIIATPGRLIDHIDRHTVDISEIDSLILDEVDQMLLMGFRNDIDLILKNIVDFKQILFFSATIDSKINKLCHKYADDFVKVNIDDENSTPELIEQEFIQTTDRSKFDDFVKAIQKDRPFMAIVFCRTKSRVDRLEEKLSQEGFDCTKIHSDLSQAKRERILKSFRDMKVQFLISTDLSSRGLDIEGVTNIYNYDFPERAEDYIHRIGRTGRSGKYGKSTSFITDRNTSVFERVKDILKNNKVD